MQGLGQGRPPRWLLAAGFCAALLAGTPLARGAPPLGAHNEPTLRLRIVWGGGPAERWQGTLSLDDGELADLTPLGLEPDEPGSLWIDGGSVHVASPSPRKFDGLDISVRADLDSRLTIDLSTETSNRPPIEISLADLLRDTQTHALDESGNRLSVRRAPGDALRVQPPNGGLVLSPSERLPLNVQPRWLGAEAGSKVRIEFELRPARGTRTLWSSAREIDWPAADLPQPDLVEELRAPQTPGAYDLSITASSRSLKQRFGLRQTLAERQVQFVVVDSAPAVPVVHAPRLIAELDPTASRWWEQLARLPGTQNWWRGPVGSSSAAVVDHALGRVVELRPRAGEAAQGGEPSWEAYPLSIDRVGACHVLEIEYPGDKRQRLGVCVMESTGAGPLTPLAIDQGLVCEATDEGAPQWRRHRIAFWPRSKNPVVLLMNRSSAESAWFGKLRVIQTPYEAPLPGDTVGPSRDWLVECDRPLLADTLGASQRFDALSGQTIDDWQTFYEAAERLAEYIELAGYSGIALTVAAEGSSLYPSSHLQPTPRYDTGIFSSHGHDPVRKDVLELLLRVFDRHGLRFVPVVRLTTPVPALEAARRARGQASEGVTWVSAHGERLLDRRLPREGAAAYYNPLDPRVQRTFIEIVDELASRCRNHRSFAGVAVRVEHEGSARLQGAEWGFDRQTLGRFAGAAGLDAETIAPADVLANHREEWVAWRAAQLTGLVQTWEQRVVAARPDAKLQLLGVGLYSLPELQGALRPQLPWVASSADALREAGFELEALRPQTNLVMAVSHRVALSAESDRRRQTLEHDRVRDLSDALGSGVLFQWREGHAEPLVGVDLRGPLKGQPATCLSQASPDSRASRQRFVQSVARADARTMIDGGTALGLIVDPELVAMRKIYRRLPDAPFTDVPGPAQPVVVRQATVGGQTFVYLVNTAPWQTTCRLRFDGPAAIRAEVWANRDLPAPAIAPQTVWEPMLEGHDLIALRIAAPNVKVQVERVDFDANQLARLDQRIRDLMRRATGLQGVRRYEALGNAGFEQPPTAEEPAPSWKLLSTSSAKIQIDGAPTHEGNSALRLSNPGGVSAVASAPFHAPSTGRLTVGAWIRVSRFDAGSQLRLAVRGIGSDYYRAAPLPADPATPAEPWRWCALRLDDLVDDGTPLEVRFEIRGPGEVSIDDVRTFDIDFSQAEKIGLAQILHLAEAQLRVDKVAECRETLDGYWPQFLAEHVAAPVTAQDELPAGPLLRQAARPAAPGPAPEPGMLDSIKRLVPRSLRWY